MTDLPIPLRRGPTAWLALVAAGTFVESLVAFDLGRVPLAMHLPVAMLSLYALSLASHDAIHGAAHDDPRVNAAVGWVSTLGFGMPYSVFRIGHTRHHQHPMGEGDAETSFGRNKALIPLRLLFANLWYAAMLRDLPRRDELLVGLCTVVTFVGMGLWPRGFGVAWVLPAQLTAAGFAWYHVYLPHSPARRAAKGWARRLVELHDAHHEWPDVPWYDYDRLLEARAARTRSEGGLDSVG